MNNENQIMWQDVKKKPIEVEAFQLTKDMLNETFNVEVNNRLVFVVENKFVVETLEGVMMAKVGDWIIKGIKGELYPCRKDIFKETYEVLVK